MALTVEDGTVVTGAESYISVADADNYFTDHETPSKWSNATTSEKEAALRYATRWLDTHFKWFSEIVDSDQELDWPRKEFTDSEGRSLGGEGTIPQRLKNATAELAYQHLKESLVEPKDEGRLIASERAGSSEVRYRARGAEKNYSFIKLTLRELGTHSNSFATIYRA